MNIDANDLLLFARVAEAGSFSRAAEHSGVPKATVSRRIAALEAQLGERLIARSTRRLTITEFGEGILENAKRMLEETEAAAAFAQHRQAAPRGRLRVSMPPDFSDKLVLTSFFVHFTQTYPEIQLELDLSPRRVDLHAERFDLAIRIAPQLPDDATLVARRLSDLSGGLYASPAYLDRQGRPTSPQALEAHIGMQLMASGGEVMPWRLRRAQSGQPEATWEGIPSGPIATNSVSLIQQLVSQGMGIALFTDRFVRPEVEAGRLERVLPDWHSTPATVWGVMPGRKLVPTRTRVFLEALAAELAACSVEDVRARLKLQKKDSKAPQTDPNKNRAMPQRLINADV